GGLLAGFPLPGGAAASRGPFRRALAAVEAAGLDPSAFPALGALPAEEASIVRQQVARRLNTPLTTSAGRLFDAVSALLGVCGDTTYEAQAAMELEAVAATGDVVPYPLELREESGTWVLDWRPMLEALLADIRAGAAVPAMAARFHAGMAAGIVAAVQRIAHESGLRTVALSGGCFQNRLLLGWTATGLAAAGLEVLTHRQVPANDGGVALGQAAIAAAAAT
ncbi:MAG: carbamoyltransferase HypF, partial [Anaerolineae bacterium]|nr:carbamoyltransferase HypF [Anaerolineae bacterium]